MAYRDEVLADDPVLYFTLDQVVPAASVDEITASTITRSGATSVASLVEASGGALEFDGTTNSFMRTLGDEGDASWHPASNAVPYALECWAKPMTVTGEGGLVVAAGNSVKMERIGADLRSAILGQFSHDDGFGGTFITTEWVYQTTTGVFAVGERVHVAVTWDPATETREHIVNGAVADSWDESIPPPGVGGFDTFDGTGAYADRTVIGNTWDLAVAVTLDPYGPYFYGVIDEVAAYHSVLDPSRWAAHYAEGTGMNPDDYALTVSEPPALREAVSLATEQVVEENITAQATVTATRVFESSDGLVETVPLGEAVAYPDVLIQVEEPYMFREGADQARIEDDLGALIPGTANDRVTLTETILITRTGDTTPPPPVENLAGTAASAGATLTWDPITGVDDLAGYTVYLDGAAHSTVTQPTATSNPTGLVNGRAYTFGVASRDTSGNLSAFRYVTVIPQPTAAPAPPTGVTATPGVRSVRVAWTNSATADVRWHEVWMNGRFLASVRSRFAATYTVQGLVPGISYAFQMRARDRYGNTSALTTEESATPLAGSEPAMTYTDFTNVTDLLGKYLLIVKGSEADGYGAGDGTLDFADDWGESKAARELVALVLSSEDETLVNHLFQNATRLRAQASYAEAARAKLLPLVQGLSGLARALQITGVSTLASLSTYYNTGDGGPYNALHAPPFAELYALCIGSALPPENVYAESDVALGSRTVGSPFSAGTTLDSAVYAGAGTVRAVVTSFSGTGGTLQVTGVARKADGTTASGRTFAVAISGNGTYVLSPTVAGDLLLQATAVTFPGGMTVGTATLTSQPPAGRTYPTVA